MSKTTKHWYSVAKQKDIELRMKDLEIMRLRDANRKLAKRICGIRL